MSAGKPVRRAATAAAALDQATPAPCAPSQAGHLRGWPVAVCGSTPGPGVTFRRIPVLLRHHPARAGKPPAGTTTALVSTTVWFGLCPAFPLVYVSYSGSRQAARSAMQDPAVRCPALLLGPHSIGAPAPGLAYTRLAQAVMQAAVAATVPHMDASDRGTATKSHPLTSCQPPCSTSPPLPAALPAPAGGGGRLRRARPLALGPPGVLPGRLPEVRAAGWGGGRGRHLCPHGGGEGQVGWRCSAAEARSASARCMGLGSSGPALHCTPNAVGRA